MIFAVLNLDIFCKNTIVDHKSLVDNCLKPFAFQAKISSRSGIDTKYTISKIYIPIDVEASKTKLTREEFDLIFPKNQVPGEKDNLIKSFIFDAFEECSEFLKNKSLRIQYNLIDVKKAKNITFLYSDGSSSFKPKCAAAAMVDLIFDESAEKVDPETGLNYICESQTRFINEGTNNIAELVGIELCLDYIKENNIRNAIITSDSEYSIKSMREWFYGWKDNNYKSYSGKEISNKDLIIRIFNKINTLDNISFRWTKGHAGQAFNEMCDELAKECIVNNLESLGE